MKKQVSVFGLHTRAALNRLLLAALGLLAVELILAGVCIARGTALTLSGSSLETALQHSFRAGIIALQVLLASSLGSNSRYSYTLQRLRVSERCVFLWSCVCNTLCFAVCADHGSCGRGILERKKRRVFGWPAGRVCGFLPQRLSAWASAAGRRVWMGAQRTVRAGAGLRDRVYAAWHTQERQPQLAGLHGADAASGLVPAGSVWRRPEHGHFPCDRGAACRARLSGVRADADT